MNVNDQILMEAGTNEVEILVFNVEDEKYGINIAKVREVIRIPELTTPPNAHQFVEGVINLRDKIIPVVNVRKALGYPVRELQKTDMVIITEFHSQWFGFVVDSVYNIYRISWKDIEPVSDTTHSESLTGIAHLEDALVLMIDVEKITQVLCKHMELNEDGGMQDDIFAMRQSKKILVAEDSSVMRNLIQDTLQQAGYTNFLSTTNGEEAWQIIHDNSQVDLVISDIEMPRIDGLHLTKLIRGNDTLQDLPVIIFSSIISEDNRNKGEAVGANAQIAKPELNKLVSTLDQFLGIEDAT